MKGEKKIFLSVIYKTFRAVQFIFRKDTLGVRLLLIKDGKVLLVRHSYQAYAYLPGGLVEFGEKLPDAVRREAAEEVGAKLYHLELFGVYSNISDHENDHIIVFLSKDFEYSGISDKEISEISVYDINDLPEDISPGSFRRLEEYKQMSKIIYRDW